MGVDAEVYQVHVEATLGLQVKVGSQVVQGQPLGTAPGFRGLVHAPVNGRVIKITFDADRHTHVIHIQA